MSDGPRGKLFYGDCLTVVRDHIRRESVDLIYLDPPFNSQRQYNNIYKDETGRPLPDQVEAFCDMWEMDGERERVLRSMPMLMREAGIDDSAVEFWRMWLNSLRYAQPRLLSYLIYMVERLIWLKAALRPNGSIYLHCDPNTSHYTKVMMDAIFGHQNFRNEIIWSYRRWPSKSTAWQTMHDVILFYSLSKRNTFNVAYEPPSESYLKRFKGKTQVLDPESGTRKLVVDQPTKGLPMRDVWEMSIIAGSAKERIGYATQKPVKLLHRIIEASSNPGDVVLDPFCGCGTTLEAAHNLGRRWIGVDIAIHAVKRVAKIRLEDRAGLVQGEDFTIEGVPLTAEGARDLWERDKYHFQKWAVEQVDGFVTSKRTADGGIDGRLYFAEREGADLQSMIIEVKGGKNVGIGVLRELRGVLEDEIAVMAGLIIMEPLGATKQRNFDRFMSEAGDLDLLGTPYARMQLLTVDQILAGKRFLTPSVVGRRELQPSLPLGGPGA